MANTRKRKTAVEPVVEETPVVEAPVEDVAESNVETATILTGKVKECTSLNVRAQPSTTARVVCVISKGAEVQIDMSASTEDFYKVYTTSGISGYSMKKFISIVK